SCSTRRPPAQSRASIRNPAKEMMTQVPASAPRPAAGALLLTFLVCGCHAERAWMQAPPATDSQRPGLQRQSSSVVTRAAAAPGNGTSEEQRFLEHQHASGDALEKAAERLDPAGSASSGELVTEAAPLPDEFVAACSMNNDTDPKQ
ncbi:unnamed protein product, partial [Prorocentrum cordatum]